MIKQSTPCDINILVELLNESFRTVADEFGLTKDNCATNNAFIDETILSKQIDRGLNIYILFVDNNPIGCVAIEQSSKDNNTYYIEKLAVLPEFRHLGYGYQLMNFASDKIMQHGGTIISVSLIDSNIKLKKWYSSLGYIETGIKEFEHLPFKVCYISKHIDKTNYTTENTHK